MSAAASGNEISSDVLERLSEFYPGKWGNCLIRVEERGKRPLDKGWPKSARDRFESGSDPGPHLVEMADHLARDGNIGLALPLAVLVLDADTEQDAAALESWLPDAPRQNTKKGAHFVLRAPGGIKMPQRTKVPLGEGIKADLRVGGQGFIVIAPSVHESGIIYEWLRPLPLDLDQLPDLPTALLDNLKLALRSESTTTSKSTAEGKWAKGTQHHQLVKMAGGLRAKNHTVKEIEAVLQVANQDRCEEPGAPEEIRRIAESAEKWGETEHSDAPIFEPLAIIEPAPLPDFPVESMGPASDFVASLAEYTQTPPDIAGVCTLGFMAGAVARKFRVNAGWTEELALYLVAVAEPGSRKSEIWKHASRPITEYEQSLREDTADEIERNTTLLALLKKRQSKNEKCYADANDEKVRSDVVEEALTIQKRIAEVESGILRAPRLLAGDITPEKLATLLAQNEERMILASAEGGQIFDRSLRYSQHNEPNMDLLLSAHAGERCSIDRQSAESILLRRPVITVVATVQPHTLKEIAKQRAFEGRGLTARLAYSFPSDVRGYRDIRKNTHLDENAVETYRQMLSRMLKIPHSPDAPSDLVVEGTSLDDFYDFAVWAEQAQREGGEMEEMRGWASKSAGLVLRIAGVLSLAEKRQGVITPDVMRRALALGLYFADHSKRAFEMMRDLTGDPMVDKVWRWMANRGAPSQDVTRQEVWQGVKGGRFRCAKDLNEPLQRLVEAGRIARREILTSGAGRPAQIWAVNPLALQQNSNPRNSAPITPERAYRGD